MGVLISFVLFEHAVNTSSSTLTPHTSTASEDGVTTSNGLSLSLLICFSFERLYLKDVQSRATFLQVTYQLSWDRNYVLSRCRFVRTFDCSQRSLVVMCVLSGSISRRTNRPPWKLSCGFRLDPRVTELPEEIVAATSDEKQYHPVRS